LRAKAFTPLLCSGHWRLRVWSHEFDGQDSERSRRGRHTKLESLLVSISNNVFILTFGIICVVVTLQTTISMYK